MAQKKILIAIRHMILRDGIKMILEDESTFTISDSVATKKELFDSIEHNNFDLLILDLDVPDFDEVETILNIKKVKNEIKILIIAESIPREKVKHLIKAGASGVIFKNRGKEELIKGLNLIAEDNQYLCNTSINILTEQKESSYSTEQSNPLTDRELEILNLICKEYTNKIIADLLNISVRTVDAHRRNLLQKTGAKNTAGLVTYAVKHDIYSP